ncbi:uncharacterized protein LOC122061662 [Macadamia integrifolia]|uniref:uncharacterized protein LOC122061662 n=1 Tax=Macadamia integrifolia TaxID=60698 RepID=UPI001C52E813|nr:uncharacterized protein LOC122061662 [Macadamia integrifolia]
MDQRSIQHSVSRDSNPPPPPRASDYMTREQFDALQEKYNRMAEIMKKVSKIVSQKTGGATRGSHVQPEIVQEEDRTGSGARIILVSSEGLKIEYALQFDFSASNNEAEYEALIAGINLARALMVQELVVHSGSQLVVWQVNGDYEAKGQRMAEYLKVVRKKVATFKEFEVRQVPRAENASADALSQLTTSDFTDLGQPVYFKVLHQPSTESAQEVLPIGENGPSWMDAIIKYLKEGSPPRRQG